MPIEVGIWKVNEGVKQVNFTPIESERKLEEILEKDISILSEDLLLIGRQVATDYGKYIDMLALDQEGNLVIIELKRQRTPRDVVAQILDYASWIQKLSYSRIEDLFKEKNANKTLEEAFVEKYEVSLPDELNRAHQMIIVSAELDNGTERIVKYLSSNFNVPVNAVFFRYFKDGENEYITRSWLIDPNVMEANASDPIHNGKKEKWNGHDFVVNFGDGENRSWEDAVKYGFISAGGGKWFSRTLQQLSIGSRVFCMIPGCGYVGIGTVTSVAAPMKEAAVQINGQPVKLIDCELQQPNMKHDLEDMDNCEYVVGIEWKKTVSRDKHFWVKGLSANQNSAFKLRSQYTIDKVEQFFGVH